MPRSLFPSPLHSGVVIYIRGRTVYIDNVFRHGANDVLLLVELLASRMPIVSYHIHVRKSCERVCCPHSPL